jgi:hypothetical protein
MDFRGPEDMVQKKVSRGHLRLFPAQDGHRAQSQAIRAGHREPHVVALHGAAGYHHRGPLGQGFGQGVFQLSHLVPAQRDSHEVLALYENPRPA